MEKLKKQYRMKELLYTLIKRNDKVALYGIGSHYTDKILHYEVDIIYIRIDRFGEREHIADNALFGRDRSRCFPNEKSALAYYNKLYVKLLQRVPKVVTGVGENPEVIPEYQMAEI
jgi:hypothetical protein